MAKEIKFEGTVMVKLWAQQSGVVDDATLGEALGVAENETLGVLNLKEVSLAVAEAIASSKAKFDKSRASSSGNLQKTIPVNVEVRVGAVPARNARSKEDRAADKAASVQAQLAALMEAAE